MPTKTPSPLAKYVEETGVRLVDLGARLKAATGREPGSASLSHWHTGHVAPTAWWQVAIEEVTGGGVTVRSWALWRAAKSKPRKTKTKAKRRAA